MKRFWEWTAFACAAFLAPAAVTVFYLLVRDTLPSRVPDMRDVSGLFTGQFESTEHRVVGNGAVIVSTTFIAIALCVRLVRGPQDSDGRVLPAFIVGSSQVCLVWGMGIAISVGAPSADAVHPQFWQYEVVYAIAGAHMLLVHRFVPHVSRDLPPTPGSTLGLGPSERVYWVGRSAHGPRLWFAGLCFAASIVAALWSVPVSLALLILVLVALQMSIVTVRINDEGVRICSTPVGWPQHRIRLADVALARVVQREWVPLHQATYSDGTRHFDVASCVFGSGPVLVLEGPEMSPLAVSLPDAAEAADLVNALIVRQRDATRLGSNV